jgi:hypothetical protein
MWHGLPVRPPRRVWLLVGGLLAMVVCAGAFALVYLGADARVAALAVDRPLAAGQTVTAQDIRVVWLVPDAGVDLVPADDASQVVGRTVTVPLAVGTLLARSQLGPAGWPPPGEAVAAVPVKPGRLPAGITEGSRVLVVRVAPGTTVEPGPPPEAPGSSPAPVPATVVQVVEAVDGSGTSLVSLLLDQDDAVAVAGAAGDLALVLAGG